MYIDIHTHKQTGIHGQIAIFNRFPEIFQKKTGELYSCGIHPWYLEKWESDAVILKQLAENKQLVAIGECGIDVNSVFFKLQEDTFRYQIEISEQYNLPLIIHCVKAFNEIIRIRKALSITQPWIFHGYQASPEITSQLLKFKSVYFSFGEKLFNLKSKAVEVSQTIPLEQIFAETDESNLPIQDIYKQLATLRKIPEDVLIAQIERNYMSVFQTKL
jgi:TatD DNase family protein